jgi:hypothetical protein
MFKKLKNSQYNIIYVTKPRCILPLRMMKSSSPIDGNIRILMIKLYSCIYTTSTRYLTKLKESWKTWAIIFPYVELFMFSFDRIVSCLWSIIYHVWSYSFNVVYIFVQMEIDHLLICSFVGCLQKLR